MPSSVSSQELSHSPSSQELFLDSAPLCLKWLPEKTWTQLDMGAIISQTFYDYAMNITQSLVGYFKYLLNDIEHSRDTQGIVMLLH